MEVIAEKVTEAAAEGDMGAARELGDMLDGNSVTGVSMGRQALSGGELAFHVGFADETAAIYIADLASPSVPGDLDGGSSRKGVLPRSTYSRQSLRKISRQDLRSTAQ